MKMCGKAEGHSSHNFPLQLATHGQPAEGVPRGKLASYPTQGAPSSAWPPRRVASPLAEAGEALGNVRN